MQQINTERVKDEIRLGEKGDPLELRKKFTLDQTKKLFVHNPEFVLENEMYNLLWDFDTQTDHLISAR